MIDHERVRAALEREAREAEELIATLSTDISELTAARAGDNSDDEHDPEGSTLAYERSQASSLVTDSRQRLRDIAAALERLESGVYGLCAECGREIAEARLEARPFAALCIDCAR